MTVVRVERPGDAAGIRETNEAAFGSPLEGSLVDTLRATAQAEACALQETYLSLVATIDDQIAGHILFTPVTLDPPVAVRIAGLGPMAVRPDHQRSGVGGQLIRAGLDACRAHGYAAVVVLGHPDYYPRFGFVPAHTFGLTCEFPCPPEAFMAIELESGSLRQSGGLVRYRPEFAEV